VVNGNMVRVFLRGSASGAPAGVAAAGGAPGAAATAGGQISSDDLFAAGTGNEGELQTSTIHSIQLSRITWAVILKLTSSASSSSTDVVL
jgi:hypothetical protein